MGQHEDTITTAAARLRQLGTDMTALRGPAGDTTRTPTRVHAPAPLDLGILDHMVAARDEVIGHTRAHQPNATPAPTDEGIYAWMDANTAHLDDAKRRAGRALVVRQSMEHALLAGDETVVRREPCPRCNCWGLSWQPGPRHAVCLNRRCSTLGGGPSTWTLAQLAHHHTTRLETINAQSAT
ncbi:MULTISPECIES: hypothetical protein [unclassified Streptomyces]|uniref:hypothetical protein n=1 Tax=unclassified Streptomyces TaxID=2593676 RepID=UPI00081B93CE|nr:hypothetical protein [Streptomyces sp. BvitLS-983]MYX88405.1 hypothetical protein [Streptomyces sp. SID4915]SCE16450.1 hypothetical protein GA0115250_144733 [Streptomyces sp. BvitLS-983]